MHILFLSETVELVAILTPHIFPCKKSQNSKLTVVVKFGCGCGCTFSLNLAYNVSPSLHILRTSFGERIWYIQLGLQLLGLRMFSSALGIILESVFQHKFSITL